MHGHALLFTLATAELSGHYGSLSPLPHSLYYNDDSAQASSGKGRYSNVPNERCSHNSFVLLAWDQLNSYSTRAVKLERLTVPSIGINAEKMGLLRADRKLKNDKSVSQLL